MIIAFLGPPGAGKGTQSQLLAKKLSSHLIDVGASLRALKQKDTPLSQLIRSLIDKGLSLPGDVLMQVIGPEILKNKDRSIIIDNFLRLPEQVTAWFEFAGKHKLKLDVVIHIVVDGQTCWQRLEKRRRVQKRADDNYKAFLVRYEQVYKTYIDQILEMLRQKQAKILTIDGSKTVAEVADDIFTQLEPILTDDAED